MRVKIAVGVLLVVVVSLATPAATPAAHVIRAQRVDGLMPLTTTVSTMGDPQQAAVLNAATTATYITTLYRGGEAASGAIEVAGVQVPGDRSDLPRTVSTSGDPDPAALLNAATMIAAAYR